MKLLYAIIAFCLLISYTPFSQTISSNAPLCGNANLTLELTATGGSTYAWKGPNSFTSTQQKPSIKNVNYRNRGVYTVTIDNKTTLTTDVNIKDPLTFTVPKEILVCEGGAFIIEPKRSKLTDSTENDAQYSFDTPLGKRVFDYYFKIQNFTAKDAGTYKVNGYSYLGCSTTQEVKVTLNTSKNCKSIEVEDLSKVKMCYGQEVYIPFTKKGDFKAGTKFKVYLHNGSNTSPTSESPTLIVEESPIILKNVNNFYNQSFRVLIVADDNEKTVGISNDRFFNPWYEYVRNYLSISSQTCDSAKLSVSLTKYSSAQWYLDGKVINGAVNKDFTVNKSGNYSFKFIGDNTDEKIDKTCLYESQPVKIELGKIEKPSAYVSNNIELCVGKPATLSVFYKSSTNYRWKKDGIYIANATNTTYQTLQEGKYQIEAKEGTCTAVSDTVVLRKGQDFVDSFIIPMATGSTMIFDSLNRVYKACNNQVFDLSIFGVPKNSKYQWFKNNELLKDTLDVIKNIKGEGRYFTRIRYGQCEVISKSIDIKYSNSVKIPIYNKNIEKCEGTSANLFFYTYFNNTKLGEGNIYQDGVKIQDWRLWGNNYYINNLTVDKSGNYYAMGKALLSDGSECIIRTDTVKINFLKKIQLTSYGFDSKLGFVPISSCDNTTAVPRWDYGNGSIIEGRETSFKWTKDGITLKQDSLSILQATQSGTYQLETAYKGGCTVVSSPYKVEFGKIDVGISENALICENQKYQIYPIIDDNSLNTFDLYKDGKILKINTSKYGTFITEEGRYKIVITNGKCEGTSPDFTLKVDKIPTSITPSDSVTFCAGKTVELKTSTEAGLSYIWERNGSVISQANQANYTANADGLYKATLLRGACWGTTPSVKLKSLANITSTATLTGDKKIDYDTETKLSINLTSHAPWTFKLSDGKEYTATKSPFEVSVKPLSTTTYSLSEVKNICGTGTVSGSAKIEIIILSAEEEKELKVEVFPVPSSEICHWKIETPQATTASIALYDASGITQYTHTSATRTTSHEGTIDLSTLKAGTYFLKLQAGEKSVTRKVVKF